MKIGIIGFGTWGKALNVVLQYNHIETMIWEYNSQSENTTDKLSDLKGCDYYLVVVPFFAFKETIEKMKIEIGENLNLIIATKGMEIVSLKTTSDIARDVNSNSKIGILSGPTHAEEVIAKMATTIVISSEDEQYMLDVQKIFNNDFFRVYTNSDVIGVELGAAVKNILAIGAGIIDGLGHGDNAKAAMITRSMKEIILLGEAIGANRETLYGLTGLGDLVVTSISKHSRNRQFGEYLGQGIEKNKAFEKIGMVVEGVYSLNAVYNLGKKYNLDLVIINSVYDVVEKNHKAEEVIKNIMTREYKSE